MGKRTSRNDRGIEMAKKITEQQKTELVACYHNTSNKELALRFSCSESCISDHASKLGLKKDIQYLRETARFHMQRPDHPGKKYWIKKGFVPKNKGKKQVEYMSEEAIERTKATRFKKAQVPWNWKEVGAERVNIYGYVELKVSEPNTWKLKHRVVWEQQYGKIPTGYNIQFKDGNRGNCDIDNLYIISRSEQLKNQNSLVAKYPREIQLAIRARGALNRQLNKYLKNTHDNE